MECGHPFFMKGKLMTDKIEINGYKEIFLFPMGDKTIILAENKKEQYRFITGEYVNNGICHGIENAVAGDNYIDIVEEYLKKCSKQLEWVRDNIPKDMGVITKEDCIPVDYKKDINNKVIALKVDTLRREFQSADSQLCLVTGGNGAYANSRGRKVFVTCLYSKEHFYVYREDIEGVVKNNKLPKWANDKLKEIKTKENRERNER